MSEGIIKVLLIEDNIQFSELMKRLFSESSNQPLYLESESSLSKGIDRIARGDINVILLDLTLPDSAGIDTFYKLYELFPGIPTIILTGIDDESLAIQAVSSGAQDYLTKGEITFDLLLRSIQYALIRKQLQNEAIKKEKLKVVLETAGGCCHQLKQPLQSISGYTELLLSNLPEKSKEFLWSKKILESAEKINQITSKLNNITRYETSEYTKGTKIIDIDQCSRDPHL